MFFPNKHLFIHIPKTGGTSLEYAIASKYFHSKQVSIKENNPYKNLLNKGQLGKVNRSKINDGFPLFQSVLNAAKEAGFELFEDSNGFKQDGFCTFDLTINNGKRYG